MQSCDELTQEKIVTHLHRPIFHYCGNTLFIFKHIPRLDFELSGELSLRFRRYERSSLAGIIASVAIISPYNRHRTYPRSRQAFDMKLQIISYTVWAQRKAFSEKERKTTVQLQPRSVVTGNRAQARPIIIFLRSPSSFTLALSQLLRSNNPLFTGRRRHSAIPKSSLAITRVRYLRRRGACTMIRRRTVRACVHRMCGAHCEIRCSLTGQKSSGEIFYLSLRKWILRH
jgi:hypothetical protein